MKLLNLVTCWAQKMRWGLALRAMFKTVTRINIRKMAIAKICYLGSGKLNFHHDIGRVGGNSEFVLVVDTLKYISAQEFVSEVLYSSLLRCF